MLVTEGPKDVRRIYEEFDVDFDKTADGALNSTLEGGHSRRRIVHHKDSTGYEIAYRLCEAVKKRDNIEISEFSVLFNLKRFDGGFFAYILKGRKGSDRRHALCRARHRRNRTGLPLYHKLRHCHRRRNSSCL